MVERRDTQRIQISCPIVYWVPNSNNEIEAQGTGLALDISIDGMMFESNEQIKATKLFIRTSSNNGGAIKVEGYIVYSIPYFNGKYRSGFRFMEPHKQVSTFVDELKRTPS